MTCPSFCDVEGCTLVYGRHEWGFSISAAALPTRANPDVMRISEKEERWQRDHGAYRTLRKQGVQPKRIDGCADVAVQAETPYEIASGNVLTPAKRTKLAPLIEELAA